MPVDRHTKKPIDDTKAGNLHFHMNLGSSYDDVIQERMNKFIPKHKSWLKDKDLKYVKQRTKEQEDAKNEKEKKKTGFDHMFD